MQLSIMHLIAELKQRINIRTSMTLVSFLCFLVLAKPYIRIGVILSWAILGIAWILARKLSYKKNHYVYYCIPLTIMLVVFLGFRFFARGMESLSFQQLAVHLHFQPETLLTIISIMLPIVSCHFLVCLLQDVIELSIRFSKNHIFEFTVLRTFVVSSITVCLTQLFLDAEPFSMGIIKFLIGAVIVFNFIAFLSCCFCLNWIQIIVGSCLFILLAIISEYLFMFRLRLFEPIDILSLGTAMNVAQGYSLFPIPRNIIFALGLWITSLIIVFSIRQEIRFTRKNRICLLLFSTITSLFILHYAMSKYIPRFLKGGIHSDGMILDFISKIGDVYISEPEGYSEKGILSLTKKYIGESGGSIQENKKPHIIVIMDEAYSDLAVLGNISTNQVVSPFISSMSNNVVNGYTLVSVLGGGTANSEYEFLTGNTMAWMSPNAIPYQQYIDRPSYSMASYLRQFCGYHCIAMHPYLKSGWNRPNAYKYLGFNEFMDVDSFPQKKLVRWYVSDQEMFEGVVETFEKNKDKSLFLFGVSMQNHGGYSIQHENFPSVISLTGFTNDYPDVEQYLSLVHETDKAVEYLITYFSNVKEKVVICFFGDHQPGFNAKFYDEVSRVSQNSLLEIQKKRKVPFFVWANFDIETKHIERTSLNYLSSYVYDVAGIPQPPYNRFLKDLEKVIPAMNVHGFYSAKSLCFLPFDEASEEERIWLENYKCLQFNAVFDEKYRHKAFFPTLE